MSIYNLTNGSDDFSSATVTPRFAGDSSVFGNNGNDSITIAGSESWHSILVDGGKGSDKILFPDYAPFESTIRGGDGDDTIYAGHSAFTRGEKDVLDGGNGSDTITFWGTDSTVSGGNGNDSIFAGIGPNTVSGGDGDDSIVDYGASSVSGGNGNDTITLISDHADVWGSNVDGGSGDDVLTSRSFHGGLSQPSYAVDRGNVLTGGQGKDSFTVTDSSDLAVTNDPAGSNPGVVGAGDQIVGIIDEITDYSAGELLAIPGTHPVETVALGGPASPYGPPPDPDHQHLVLGDGDYALIRGTLTAPGSFTVDPAAGHDLLVVYDAPSGSLQGAVALLGVTDASSVLIG
ncbi:calcium-binding protein [Dankookia sp. P2]|uniref:calcium-binding protein n=1 Tax=Dankookia sp. P2 TaxID=3423955 RepID=UPI003D67CE07